MLDSGAGSRYQEDIMLSGCAEGSPHNTKVMSRTLTRGHIVVVGGNRSRFMVWSHGPDDALCLEITSTGVIRHGCPPTRFRKSALLVSGQATEEMLAGARIAVAGLPQRAAAATEFRETAGLLPEPERSRRGRGTEFWNGNEIVPDCRWVGAAGGQGE